MSPHGISLALVALAFITIPILAVISAIIDAMADRRQKRRDRINRRLNWQRKI